MDAEHLGEHAHFLVGGREQVEPPRVRVLVVHCGAAGGGAAV
jgi:hypothetical protein